MPRRKRRATDDDSNTDEHSVERDEEYIRYLRSALAGYSSRRCYNIAVGSSSRYARCQRSSHTYRPIPDHMKAAALKFFELHRDARASSTKDVYFLTFPAFLSLILT
jgi:hypothetical protein